MRNTPFTVAEEMLGATSAGRGLSGMERTAAPKGPNMYDGGPASKVGVNTQPFNNARMMEQNVMQNTTAAIPQAGAAAIQQGRKMQLVGDNQEYKANQLLEERKSEILTVMNAPATLALGNMNGPDMAKFREDIATGKAMAMGVNPDLAQNQVSEQNYGMPEQRYGIGGGNPMDELDPNDTRFYKNGGLAIEGRERPSQRRR